jgi:hypothetical protein
VPIERSNRRPIDGGSENSRAAWTLAQDKGRPNRVSLDIATRDDQRRDEGRYAKVDLQVTKRDHLSPRCRNSAICALDKSGATYDVVGQASQLV